MLDDFLGIFDIVPVEIHSRFVYKYQYIIIDMIKLSDYMCTVQKVGAIS